MSDIQGHDTAEKNASNQSGGSLADYERSTATDAELFEDAIASGVDFGGASVEELVAQDGVDGAPEYAAPEKVATVAREFKHNYELPVPDEDAYESQFGIIVVVENEAEQIQAFANIKALGYSVRVVTI